MRILPVLCSIGLTVLLAGCQFESKKPLLQVLSGLDEQTYPQNITVIDDGTIVDICTRGSRNTYDCKSPDPGDDSSEILLEFRPLPSEDPAKRVGYYILQNPADTDDQSGSYYYWVSPAAFGDDFAFAVMLPEADKTVEVTTREELFAKADELALDAIKDGLDWRMTSNPFVRETKPDDYRWFAQEIQHHFLKEEIDSDIEATRRKYMD